MRHKWMCLATMGTKQFKSVQRGQRTGEFQIHKNRRNKGSGAMVSKNTRGSLELPTSKAQLCADPGWLCYLEQVTLSLWHVREVVIIPTVYVMRC